MVYRAEPGRNPANKFNGSSATFADSTDRMIVERSFRKPPING